MASSGRFHSSSALGEDEVQPLSRELFVNESGDRRLFGSSTISGIQLANGSPGDIEYRHNSDDSDQMIPLQTMTVCAADGKGLSEELANYYKRQDPGSGPQVRFRTFSDPGHNKKPPGFSGRLSRTASGTLKRMRHVSTHTFPAVAPEDENPQRGTWSNQFEFFLSCLGFAVGLGNVWRFPFLCYESGGGAFLIPFILMLTLCGLPLLLLELTIGQYASEGPITIWKMSPVFKGLGVGMVIISLFLASYYNVVTGWAFYYLFASLSAVLPWACCDPAWGPSCVSFTTDCPGDNTTSFAGANYELLENFTLANASKPLFAADYYFHRVALGLSSGIDNIGSIQWHLAGSLFTAWTLVFLVLMRGIKSFGKTVYFTSLFPYVVLVILFVRAVIEEGAVDGIIFYLTPKWEKLLEARVWGDALVQVFYSTSVSTGGIITLASYNRFHNNILRDTLILGIGNTLTSIFSGVVVFSILGFMAHRQNTKIENIVTKGPGLTFITYPQAVTLLPAAPLWSALFFVMLITLALSSMFPTVENITTAIIDQFPGTLRPFKFWITLATCVFLFLAGVIMTTNGGMYILQLMDKYAVGWALVIIGLIQVLVCGWRYGYKRLYADIEEMLGVKPSMFWAVNWLFVCPLLLIFCLVFSWIQFSPLSYGSYTFPDWSNGIGWFLSMVSFIPIPIVALYTIIRYQRRHPGQPLLQVLKEVSLPLPSWGPALAIMHKPPMRLPSPPKIHAFESNRTTPLLKQVEEEDEVFNCT